MSFNIRNNTEVQSRFFKPICLGSLEMTFKTIQLKTVLQQFYNLVIGFFFSSPKLKVQMSLLIIYCLVSTHPVCDERGGIILC